MDIPLPLNPPPSPIRKDVPWYSAHPLGPLREHTPCEDCVFRWNQPCCCPRTSDYPDEKMWSLEDQDTDLRGYIINDVSLGNPVGANFANGSFPPPDVLHNYATKQQSPDECLTDHLDEIWSNDYMDIYFGSGASVSSPTPSDRSDDSLMDVNLLDFLDDDDDEPEQEATAPVMQPPATTVKEHQAARQPTAPAQRQTSRARQNAAASKQNAAASRQNAAPAQKQCAAAARQPVVAAAPTVAQVCAAPSPAVMSSAATDLHTASETNPRRPLTARLPAVQTRCQPSTSPSTSAAPAKRRGRPPANPGLEHDYSRKPPQKAAARRGAPKKSREPKVTKSKISKDKHNANERERRTKLRLQVETLIRVIREGTEVGDEVHKKLAQSKALIYAAQAINVLNQQLLAAGLDPNAQSCVDLNL